MKCPECKSTSQHKMSCSTGEAERKRAKFTPEEINALTYSAPKVIREEVTKQTRCNVRPISDWVAIIPDEDEQRYGRIVLADIARVRPTRGTVLRCGQDASDNQHEGGALKPGDYVVFERLQGKDIVIQGIDCRLVRAKDVLCVVEKQSA